MARQSVNARPSSPVRDPYARDRHGDLRFEWAVLGALVAYLPFTFLGYGTDIDVANVLRAGRSWLDDGDYQMSRGPGAAIHELATAALDQLGGSLAVNLAALAFAGLALWAVHELVHDDGGRWPGWATLALAANPWFWIASTSLGDFTWALGLGLGGAALARRGHRTWAGLLFGLAIGCRASTALVAGAWLLAERTGDGADRPPWSATVRTSVVTLVVGAACFVPPWLAADRSLDFLDNELAFAGWGVHLGRWAVKNAAAATVPAALVLLVGARHLFGSLARWRQSTVVRCAVVLLVTSELLFFRLPFKPVHLLPVVAAVVLLVGAGRDTPRRWVVALVVAQLLGGVVGTTLAAPDQRNDAESGRLDLGITTGVLLNDAQCRFDDRDRGRWPEGTSAAEVADAMARADAAFHCQTEAWRADP